jgi:hypothetical protein
MAAPLIGVENPEGKSVVMMQQAAARTLSSTPALAEKVKDRPPLENDTEKERVISGLLRQVEEQKTKNRDLELQFKARVGQFTQEESTAKSKMDSLEKQFHAAPHLDDDFKQRVGSIRGVQDNIVKELDQIQQSTSFMLQDQEKELMRAFRARLTDLTRELETQQSKKGDYSAELQARHRRVLSELHLSQELAQDFDKKNQRLQQENQKLQEKLRTREDDRQCLMREVMGAKRELAKLKQVEARVTAVEGTAEAQNASANPSAKAVDQAKLQSSENLAYKKELKYREAIKEIKRSVDTTSLEAKQLQKRLQQMFAETPRLAVLLRKFVDEVKANVSRRRPTPAPGAPGAPPPGVIPDSSVSIHEFTQRDGERVMELVLSQREAVQLLYSHVGLEEDEEEKGDWLQDMFGKS